MHRIVWRYTAAFLIALVVFGAALVALEPVSTGDEPHYVIEAVSLARDQDRDLANQYDDPALMSQVYGAPTLEPQAYHYPGGRGLVSVHPPGLSVLLAPVAAITTTHFWMRVEIAVIGAIGALLLLVLLERVPIGTPLTRWLAWAAVVLSAPFVVYATALFPEMPGVTLTLAAAVLLTGRRPGPAALAAASTCACLLPWLNVRFLPLTFVAVAVAAWRAWEAPRRRPALAAVLAPALVLGITFAAGFAYWYGSPWPSAPYATISGATSLDGAYRIGFGGLFSADVGWLPWAPVQLLALVAIGLAVRRLGRPALIGVVAAAVYLAAVALSGVGFTGTAFAGRLLVVLIPLAAVPLLVLLATQRRWLVWAPFVLLGLVSLALTASTVTGQTPSVLDRYERMWPSYQAVYQPDQSWTGTVTQLGHDVGRVADAGSSVIADGGPVLIAPRGTIGVLERGTTPILAASTFTAAVQLRADAATTARVARIEVRDDRGTLLTWQDVLGRAVPPQLSYRTFQLGFSSDRASRLTFTVRTTGAVGLAAGPPSIVNHPGGTLVGSHGVPDVGATLVLLAVLGLLGVALVAYDRNAGRISSA